MEPDQTLRPEEQPQDADRALRPQVLDEFIGQKEARANLAVFIESAKRRGQAMDHTLFYGPPGLGKTTLAQIMSRELGVNFRMTSGPVLAKAGGPDDSALQKADFSHLKAPAEMALVKKLAEWPRLVELAATHHEPHRIAFYLFELASEFHALQHAGKMDQSLRFILEEQPALSTARLAMIRAVAVVISAGLGILGVTPKNEMR